MSEIEQKPDELTEHVYSMDEEIKKEVIALTYDKNELLDKTKKIVILGLVTNRWKKPELVCNIDGNESRLRISKANKNYLIDKFGSRVGDWIGQTVKVTGILWEGDIKGRQGTGVTLEFE